MIKSLLLLTITTYRRLSNFIKNALGIRGVCRFTPTCSEYTYMAVEKHGIIKGSILGIMRILRCNPLTKGGYDPVPK